MIPQVLTGQLTFTSLPVCDLSDTSKDEIKHYFINSYSLNESIFVSIKDENVMYLAPDRLRLPLIFYYNHTAAVYVNKLVLSGLCAPEERVDLKYETLFETGVDEMSWDDTENYRLGGSFIWPCLSECVEFRKKVKDLILKVIDRTPLELPVTMHNPWWALFMGFEHERIHLETSSVLIRQLPVGLVEIPAGWKYGPLQAEQPCLENPFVIVDEKHSVDIGKPYTFPSYGWDNEYGHWQADVAPFKATKHLTTNRQYLRFVERGGYETQELWSREGWAWKEYRKALHPTFWVCDKGCKSGCGGALAEHSHCKPHIATHSRTTTHSHCKPHTAMDKSDTPSGYRLRRMFDEVDLPLDWPVEVNYHEAKAFCQWMGKCYRLATEAEHHVMRGQLPFVEEGTRGDPAFNVGVNANMHLKYGSSTPVNMYKASSAGFTDTFGNVFEWVEDHFNGLPGTATHYLYDDFSTPTFDGKHSVILGGSWISTGVEASRFARYAFRRHFMQHAGFRVAMTLNPSDAIPVRLVISNPGNNINNFADDVCLPSDNLEPGFIPSTSKQIRDDNDNTVNSCLALELDVPGEHNYSKLSLELFLRQLEQKNISKSDVLLLGVGCGKTLFDLCNAGFSRILGIDPLNCLVKEASQRIYNQKVLSTTVTVKQLTWIPNEVGNFSCCLFISVDDVSNPVAWFLRMAEVLLEKGLLIAVSAKGAWPAAKLQQTLNNRLHLLESAGFAWRDHDSNIWGSCVTVWSRNHLDAPGQCL